MSKTKDAIMRNEWLEEDHITPEDQQLAYEYFEATKTIPTIAEHKELVKQAIKEQILNGTLNPLEFYRQAKLASDCIDELKKDPEILKVVSDEVDKYPKGKAEIHGCIVTMASRNTPDYNSCEDPVYNELKEKIKTREAFLKNLPPEGSVDPMNGNFIKAPKFSTTSYVTVKI